MEQSILKSTRTMLGVPDEYSAFDLEILTNINAAMSDLHQIGVGLGAPVEDESVVWADLALPDIQLNWAKTLIFLKVKKAFDPPGTSYLIEAVNSQIEEQTWRLREYVQELKQAAEEVTPA